MLTRNDKYILIFATFLLVLGMMMMILSGADAKVNKKNRRPDPIVIVDNTNERWESVIKETIGDFNRVMPKNGPKIKYVRGPEITCSSVDICSGNLNSNIWGLAWSSDPRNGNIKLQDFHDPPTTREDMENVACHEFMHIIGKVYFDDYNSNPNSCVLGDLTDPGQWDIDRIKKIYKK